MRNPQEQYQQARSGATTEAWQRAGNIILAGEAGQPEAEPAQTKTEVFLETCHAQPTPPEMFMLWAEVMQTADTTASSTPNLLDMSMPEKLFMPTAGDLRLRIPIATGKEAISLFYMPGMAPLDHEPYKLAASQTRVAGFEFGQTKVYTLALNEAGTDLVAFTNQPHEGTRPLDSATQHTIGTPGFQQFKQNVMEMLRGLREQGYPQPVLADLPGAPGANQAAYSGYKLHPKQIPPEFTTPQLLGSLTHRIKNQTSQHIPETPEEFTASLNGRVGFTELTLQELIDRQRWEFHPAPVPRVGKYHVPSAPDRARILNQFLLQIID